MEDWLIAIISVAVGFVLHFITDIVKETKRSKLIQEKLKREINSIKESSKENYNQIIELPEAMSNRSDYLIPGVITARYIDGFIVNHNIDLNDEQRKVTAFLVNALETYSMEIQSIRERYLFDNVENARRDPARFETELRKPKGTLELICMKIIHYEDTGKNVRTTYDQYTHEKLKQKSIDFMTNDTAD